MSIIRPDLPSDRFTQVSNAWLRDERLSYRARGLLASLMSHAPGWRITVDALVAAGTEGRDAIRSALNELAAIGYLRRGQARSGTGQFGSSDWEIADPFAAEPPLPRNPPSAEPSSAEPQPKKTISQKNTPSPTGMPPAEPKPKRESRKKPVTEIPVFWAPNSKHRELAAESTVDVDEQAALMKDWALANGRKYSDWDAMFRNWLRKAMKWAAENKPPEGEPKAAPDAWMNLGPKRSLSEFAPVGWSDDE